MFEFFFKYPHARVFERPVRPAWGVAGVGAGAADCCCGGGAGVVDLVAAAERGAESAEVAGGRDLGAGGALVALVLLLLWEPAMTVAELRSQQNIIAVLVDDSKSMAIADSGSDGKQTREAAAVKAMQDGVLAGLQKRFQTRVYRLDGKAIGWLLWRHRGDLQG